MSVTLTRLAIIAAICAAFFLTGWHEKGLRDEDAKLAAVNAQMLLDQTAQRDAEAKAQEAEAALQKQKDFTYDITQQWAKERGAKGHVDCNLSAGTLRLLRSATGAANNATR